MKAWYKIRKHEIAGTLPVIHVNNADEIWHLAKIFFQDWIFRGQKDSSWELATSLERHFHAYLAECDKGKKDDKNMRSPSAYSLQFNVTSEKVAIENFKRLVNSNTDDVATLALMQHYGGKTRLLDVTNSLFVALYFAFEEYNTNKKSKAIWCFNKRVLLKNFYSRIFYNDIEDDNGDYIDEQINNLIVSNEECISKANEIISNYDNLEEEKQLGIIPLLLPCGNKRINSQNAAFLFPCNIHRSFLENFYHSQYSEGENPGEIKIKNIIKLKDDSNLFDDMPLVKIIIPTKLRGLVENILVHANITPFSIYPDLTGIAKSIRYW